MSPLKRFDHNQFGCGPIICRNHKLYTLILVLAEVAILEIQRTVWKLESCTYIFMFIHSVLHMDIILLIVHFLKMSNVLLGWICHRIVSMLKDTFVSICKLANILEAIIITVMLHALLHMWICKSTRDHQKKALVFHRKHPLLIIVALAKTVKLIEAPFRLAAYLLNH